jgi:recombination protein RecA
MWGKEDKTNGSVESKITVNKGKEWSVIPYSTTTLHMEHGKGVDIERDIVGVCEKAGIIKKGGAWYNYGDSKYQGISKLAEAMRENPSLREELYRQALKSTVAIEISEEKEEEDEGTE